MKKDTSTSGSAPGPAGVSEECRRLRLVQLVDKAEAAKKRGFGKERATLLSPYFPEVKMGINLLAERPHRFEDVEGLMFGMLLEQELDRTGSIPNLELLKKMRVAGSRSGPKSGVYAVDGIRGQLPDFPEIRTLTVNDKNLVVPLSLFLDLTKISRYLKENGFAVAEKRDGLGRRMLEVTSKQGGKFCVGSTRVVFDHRVLEKNENLFDEGLTRFVEFVCVLPFKHAEWALGSSVVYLHELRPFFNMMFSVPNCALSDMFLQVAKIAQEHDLSEVEYFQETNKSRVLRQTGKRTDKEKSHMLKKDCFDLPHVGYIIVKANKDGTKVAVVGLDSNVDINALGKALAAREGDKLFMSTPRQKISRSRVFVNKGSRFENRVVPRFITETGILDEEGRKIAKIISPGTIMIPLSKGPVKAAAELLDTIYDQMLIYTPAIRNSETGDSRLTDIERQVYSAISSLIDFYNYFLKVDHEKEAFRVAGLTGSDPVDVSARGWLLAKLREEPSSRFEAKVLHALKAIRDGVDTSKFSLYGDRSRELYDMLNTMIGRMEALCAIPVDQKIIPPQPN